MRICPQQRRLLSPATGEQVRRESILHRATGWWRVYCMSESGLAQSYANLHADVPSARALDEGLKSASTKSPIGQPWIFQPLAHPSCTWHYHIRDWLMQTIVLAVDTRHSCASSFAATDPGERPMNLSTRGTPWPCQHIIPKLLVQRSVLRPA